MLTPIKDMPGAFYDTEKEDVVVLIDRTMSEAYKNNLVMEARARVRSEQGYLAGVSYVHDARSAARR